MKVNTDVLLEQDQSFGFAIRQLQEIRETLETVAGKLDEESFGEDIRPHIQAAGTKVGNLQYDLAQLKTVLEQIGKQYTICEERILDEAEQAAVHYGLLPIMVQDLPMLSQLQGPLLSL